MVSNDADMTPDMAPHYRAKAQGSYIEAYKMWEPLRDDGVLAVPVDEMWQTQQTSKQYEALWRACAHDVTHCLFADRGKACPERETALEVCEACTETAREKAETPTQGLLEGAA